MTTILIDADGIAFAASAAVQKTIKWDDDLYTTHASFEAAQEAFDSLVGKIVDAVDTDANVILCFSCPSRRYFRHDLLPTYKSNRSGAPPLVLKDLRTWAEAEYETKTKPHLEADDVLGILATHPKLIPGEKVIASGDKDLRQIPGLHLNSQAPHEGVYRVIPEFAERFLWTQVLMGDQVDGYSGCPGIGPKTAEKVLSGAVSREDYEAACWAAYEKAGLTSSDFSVQVNTARILSTPSYNFKTKEPILWQFPKRLLSAAPATATSPATRKSRKQSKTSSTEPAAGAD